MTPAQLKKARRKLGLTPSEMGVMLGYKEGGARCQIHHMEHGRKNITPPVGRLVEAYLDGYRPADWPDERP